MGIGWLDILHFWSSGAFIGTQKFSEFPFADVASPSRSVSIMDLESYFNRTKGEMATKEETQAND